MNIINFTKILIKIINGFGDRRKCYICGKTFFYFTKYRKGSKKINEFRKKLDGVGSDLDNFGCIYCGSHDRERHLFMYFDKLMLWDKMKNGKILHFAPEKNLMLKIHEQIPHKYIKADLNPTHSDIKKMDATKIPFPNNTFDYIIANHVLEHIPDYLKALNEFHRTIKPGGVAVLQTPYSRLLRKNFEDEGIDSDALRKFFHGQEDHVRTFGKNQFFRSIESAGFSLIVQKHEDYLKEFTSCYYGVNSKENLILAIKEK